MPYNPFAAWPVSGTWEDHLSYSLGGTDYPLAYGTPIAAPAAGTLYTSGRPRSGQEFQCGQVGSAGRRSVLLLDHALGDVVAVVFQHQSRFGDGGRHYAEREVCGWSGASADGNDWGGDVHLHIHCLTADGARRRFEDYFKENDMALTDDIITNYKGEKVPAAGVIQQTEKRVAELADRIEVLLGSRFGNMNGDKVTASAVWNETEKKVTTLLDLVQGIVHASDPTEAALPGLTDDERAKLSEAAEIIRTRLTP